MSSGCLGRLCIGTVLTRLGCQQCGLRRDERGQIRHGAGYERRHPVVELVHFGDECVLGPGQFIRVVGHITCSLIGRVRVLVEFVRVVVSFIRASVEFVWIVRVRGGTFGELNRSAGGHTGVHVRRTRSNVGGDSLGELGAQLGAKPGGAIRRGHRCDLHCGQDGDLNRASGHACR